MAALLKADSSSGRGETIQAYVDELEALLSNTSAAPTAAAPNPPVKPVEARPPPVKPAAKPAADPAKPVKPAGDAGVSVMDRLRSLFEKNPSGPPSESLSTFVEPAAANAAAGKPAAANAAAGKPAAANAAAGKPAAANAPAVNAVAENPAAANAAAAVPPPRGMPELLPWAQRLVSDGYDSGNAPAMTREEAALALADFRVTAPLPAADRSDTGERRTYIGAAPRDFVSALSDPVNNPVSFIMVLHIILGVAFLILTFSVAAVFISAASAGDAADSEIAESVFPTMILLHRRVGEQEALGRVSEGTVALAVVAAAAVSTTWHFWCAYNSHSTTSNALCGSPTTGSIVANWLEIGITSTLLIFAVAVLCGVRDLHALTGAVSAHIFGVIFGVIAFSTGSRLAAMASLVAVAHVVTVISWSVHLHYEETLADQASLRSVRSLAITSLIFYGLFFCALAARSLFPAALMPSHAEGGVVLFGVLFKATTSIFIAALFQSRYTAVRDRTAVIVE